MAATHGMRPTATLYLYDNVLLLRTKMVDILEAQAAPLFVHIFTASPTECTPANTDHRVAPRFLLDPHFALWAPFHSFLRCHGPELSLICSFQRRKPAFPQRSKRQNTQEAHHGMKVAQHVTQHAECSSQIGGSACTHILTSFIAGHHLASCLSSPAPLRRNPCRARAPHT